MTEKDLKKAIVIAGPTASGKSSLAFVKAHEAEKEAVIINADSMQIYADLKILTAVPDKNHLDTNTSLALYGFLNGNEPCSAALWAEYAAKEIKNAFEANKLPIIVGGTGLYISSLTDGLAPVPDIPDDIREEVRRMDFTIARNKLKECDEVTFNRFTDKHRTLRALEVFMATGRPHSDWQKEVPVKLIEADWEKILLCPERNKLYESCDKRFLEMLEQGAIEEVETLLAKHYPSYCPIMKALGVPEIASFLLGELEKDEMIKLAQTRTRNYAKRQMTWFKNRFTPTITIS